MLVAPLPRPAILLGLSGILPQALCLAIAYASPEWHWVALASGCFYASAILSFLGGMWWMQGLAKGAAALAPYVFAVIASLGAWAAVLPWSLGWSWPVPSLVLLGIALIASPLVDHRLAHLAPPAPGWLRLRFAMASGLGLATLLLAAS